MSAKIMAALVAAQGELRNPPKDKIANTGAFKYAYADLAGVLDHVRPVLAKHSLGLVQDVEVAEGRVGITTTLIHSSGESLKFGPLAASAPVDMQKLGSAITYARRYALVAALGIAADEDDDAASVPPAPAKKLQALKQSKATQEDVTRWTELIASASQFVELKSIADEIAAHDVGKAEKAELLALWSARKEALNAS
jgi:hypothetical protein